MTLNTIRKVILETREPGKQPVISSYVISKSKFDVIMKIVHDKSGSE